MKNRLWVSTDTGIHKKGTTFKELQSLFIENITTDFIYESLYSCSLDDDALRVKENLTKKEFDLAGVINQDTQEVVGYVYRDDLKEGTIKQFKKSIDIGSVISNSTPVSKLMEILLKDPFTFVLVENKIEGIVTKADINKPIVRIYLFGIISLFEMHLIFWINEFFKNDSWVNKLKEKRIDKVEKIYKIRKGKNEDLSLLECTQLCDKKEILKSSDEFLNLFGFSKKRLEILLNNTEKIRNELAHSQKSITSNLKWSSFVTTISDIEKFLSFSDKRVEEKVKATNQKDG